MGSKKFKSSVAVFLEGYNAVYVEIPKVGCTSLKVAFAQLLGIPLDSFGGNPHLAVFPAIPHDPEVDGPLFPGLFSFAFVRNPWDRLVSCYRDKIAGEVDGFTYFNIRPGVADCLAHYNQFTAGMSFSDFVECVALIPDRDADAHFRSQYTFITNGRCEIAVDFVGRYESLPVDLQYIWEEIKLPEITLPRLQAAHPPVDYQDYYTPHTRSLVAKRFLRDIEMFGYEYDAL